MRIPNQTHAAWLLKAAAGPHGVSRSEVIERMGRTACGRSTQYLTATEQIVRHVFQHGRSQAVRYFCTAEQRAAWLADLEAARTQVREPVTVPSATPAPLPEPVLPVVYQVSGLYAIAGQVTHCAGTMPIERPQQQQQQQRPRLLPTAEAAPYVRRPDSRQADCLPSRQGDWLIYPGGKREHAPLPQAARRAQEPARI